MELSVCSSLGDKRKHEGVSDRMEREAERLEERRGEGEDWVILTSQRKDGERKAAQSCKRSACDSSSLSGERVSM